MSDKRKISPAEIEGVRSRLEAGELVRVRKTLRRWTASRIPRRSIVSVSRLARGVRLDALALRWLYPIVRPESGMVQPSDAEKVEYARALISFGAFSEAERLLLEVSASRTPEAEWSLAALRIRTWDWKGAIPLLERVSESGRLTSYPLAQVRIALAASVLHGTGDGRKTRSILDKALRDLPAERGRIEFDCLQLRAQSYLFIDPAERSLAEAERQIENLQDRLARRGETFIHVRCHELVEALAFLKGSGHLRFRKAMASASERFAAIGFHEHARGALYRRALWTEDQNELHRLYFGTPHEGFRKRLLKDGLDVGHGDGGFTWEMQGPRSRCVKIDVAAGLATPGGSRLKPQQLPHATLLALTRDLYRPMMIGEVAQWVYPKDRVHPQHTVLKAHQCVSRLRSWFESSAIPIEITFTAAGYRLGATGPVMLELNAKPQSDAKLPSAVAARLERLTRLKNNFSSEDAARLLGVSERSVRRTLNAGVETGAIERMGSGPATSYRIRLAD